jgi:hypothetical protein
MIFLFFKKNIYEIEFLYRSAEVESLSGSLVGSVTCFGVVERAFRSDFDSPVSFFASSNYKYFSLLVFLFSIRFSEPQF